MTTEDPMHLSSPEENDPDQFLHKARQLVYSEIRMGMKPNEKLPEGHVIYIVWFSKTLQNWKALLSTNQADGRYYEVTYNGDKREAYVDIYEKIVNSKIPDDKDETYERVEKVPPAKKSSGPQIHFDPPPAQTPQDIAIAAAAHRRNQRRMGY